MWACAVHVSDGGIMTRDPRHFSTILRGPTMSDSCLAILSFSTPHDCVILTSRVIPLLLFLTYFLFNNNIYLHSYVLVVEKQNDVSKIIVEDVIIRW